MRTKVKFPSVPALLVRGWRPHSLPGVRVVVCPGIVPVGGLGGLPTLLGGIVCRGQAQYPAFAPDFSKGQLSFLSFVFFVQNLCHLPVCRVILSLI